MSGSLSELDGDTKIGLGEAEITFTGSGAKHLKESSVATSNNGQFTITGQAPNKEGKWKVQAHYAGDSDFQSSDSNTMTYNVKFHKTGLSNNPVVAGPTDSIVPIPPSPLPSHWGVILIIILGVIGIVIYLKNRHHHARSLDQAPLATDMYPPVVLSVEVRGGIES
jgi:hypothetical protein